MNLRFADYRRLSFLGIVVVGAALLATIFLPDSMGLVWNVYDYKALDTVYRLAVKSGHGPQPSFSPQLIYLDITDSSYDSFGSNVLDRRDMAKINLALKELSPQAVAYDIIFARPTSVQADASFSDSLRQLGSVYLPVGFALDDAPHRFKWHQDQAFTLLAQKYLATVEQDGEGRPMHAVRVLRQYEDFAAAAFGSGDISALADSDSVYRHCLMVVKVDQKFSPSLSLAMYLDWAGVEFEDIRVEWGKRIIIPAGKNSFLERDVIIPIDRQGRAYVPFVAPRGNDFQQMAVHELLRHMEDEHIRGNLLDLFEGNFVFISDVAAGSSDRGDTPLETGAHLVNIHASMLNSLLTSTFYSAWSCRQLAVLTGAMYLLLLVASFAKHSWPLYLAAAVVVASLLGLSWWEFIHFRLLPLVSILALVGTFFIIQVVILQMNSRRERAFIRSTFARYVPEKVVHELLAKPEMIELGGEERIVSVLFSDLADFTTISEKMAASDLVSLLNDYLTEMTDIILQHGGIIDKFLGDAIMAEYGIPLENSKHADLAVGTALHMQQRLVELREEWQKRNLPALKCRVGINTGRMIVGNIGSHAVLDYTVIGDAVNLASRLEGVNKLYGTSILISEFTHAHLTPGLFATRALDVIKVKGKSQSVKVYEVYGHTSDQRTADEERFFRLYDEGFSAYLQQNIDRAQRRFSQALELQPQDQAAQLMLRRCEQFDIQSENENWDGSITLQTK